MVTLPSLAALRAFEATVRLGGPARRAEREDRLRAGIAAVELTSPPAQSAIRVKPAGARRLSAAGGALSLLEDVGIGTGAVRAVEVLEELGSHAKYRRSWHRDDRPPGARGRARSTGHWRLRQRSMRMP